MDEIFSRPPPRRPDGSLLYDKRLWARLDAARHLAGRFVFTDRASDLMGRFAFDPVTGPLILTNRQFAIPPFGSTYVEFDSKKFHSHTPRLVAPPETSDLTIGYLTVGREVYSFVRGPDGDAGVGLTSWEVRPPGDPEAATTNIPLVGGRDDWIKIAVALGTTVEHIDSEDMRESLVREIGLHWPTTIAADPETIGRYLSHYAGDVRNLWVALLWINRPSKMRFDPHPAGARLVRGRRVAYRRHVVVDVDLTKIRVVRNAILLDYERASPINHRVRGAFHHSGGRSDCGHDWPLIPDENAHWLCARCGQKRWWVKEHRRGRYELGINDSEYSVSVGGR